VGCKTVRPADWKRRQHGGGGSVKNEDARGAFEMLAGFMESRRKNAGRMSFGAQGKPALLVLADATVRLRIGIQGGEEIEIAGGTQFELA